MSCKVKYYNDIAIYQIGAVYSIRLCRYYVLEYRNGKRVVNQAIILLPNQSIQFSANANEIDQTKYSLSFSGSGTRSATVIRKLYIE